MQYKYYSATIPGYDHIKTMKNNQDALCVLEKNNHIFGVISDGCGSGEYSELASRLTVTYFSHKIEKQILQDQIYNFLDYQIIVDRTYLTFIDFLENLKIFEKKSVFQNGGLATLIGFIIGPQDTLIYHVGDGVYLLNGQMQSLDNYDNTPPYPGYNIFSEHIKFNVEFCSRIKTIAIDSLVIGSDGAEDLFGLSEKKYPGSEEKIGDMSQIWEDDKYFKNNKLLQRKLLKINTRRNSKQFGTLEGGYLHDDTSLIVVKREEKEE